MNMRPILTGTFRGSGLIWGTNAAAFDIRQYLTHGFPRTDAPTYQRRITSDEETIQRCEYENDGVRMSGNPACQRNNCHSEDIERYHVEPAVSIRQHCGDDTARYAPRIADGQHVARQVRRHSNACPCLNYHEIVRHEEDKPDRHCREKRERICLLLKWTGDVL